MLQSKAISQEVINEIGTQTLARFGLNIFSLNTYNAYEQSAAGSINVFDAYDKHKNNPYYFGQTFEDLDVMARNISSGLNNKKTTFATTDNLGEVNHPITDVKEFDYYGNNLKLYQHKVVKDSKELFGKNNKYLQNDKIVVASDDYEKHKNYLENMINNTKDPITKQNAQELLSKLEKSDISRSESENARTTAIKMQATQAGYHVVQAGISDGIVVALSTLASGTIYEIKDALHNKDSQTTVMERIERLLKKVLKDFYKTFKRGAWFGFIDVGVGILSQMLKSISSKLNLLWKELRTSFKSIYNAIHSYISGEIKSYEELLSVIIKGILSAMLVVGTVAFETQLETFLAPIVTPTVASFLAPALAIVVGSLAVVVTMKGVDLALNTLFGVLAQRDVAKMKLEEIQSICGEFLPDLIMEQGELQELIDRTYQDKKLTFEKSFADFQYGLSKNNIDAMLNGLIGINGIYGKKLQFYSFSQFDNLMLSDESFKL